MEVIADAGALQARVREMRCSGRTIGLVPTMGYLHDGHLRLVSQARTENDIVVVSIYVNPTQFAPNEDFERYPRDTERDERLLSQASVDVVFLPDEETMYPGGPEAQSVWVEPGSLAQYLCGASRPGHFRGVATVVAKLFNMVQPDRAYFGQKDAQQATIITRMSRELAFPVEVRIVPTVRDSDGMALSSRNAYLTPNERVQATSLAQALELARCRIDHGERDARKIEEAVRHWIVEHAPVAQIDYVSVADPTDLTPLTTIDGAALVALAVYFGRTRLIDNTLVGTNAA